MKRYGTLVLGILCFFFIGCQHQDVTSFTPLSYEAFDSISIPAYRIKDRNIRHHIDSLRLSTRDTIYIDLLTNTYYAERRPYLWITKNGVDHRADSLLAFLQHHPATGLPQNTFFVRIIQNDLQQLRTLTFQPHENINRILARLEYYLTKAYLRYAAGQRFGYVNPRKLFNRLEKEDTTKKHYRTLFDLPVATLSQSYADSALHCLRNNQLPSFLHAIQPSDTLYTLLCDTYNQPNDQLTSEQRTALRANIERMRWRTTEQDEPKYVLVNIPAWDLRAIDIPNHQTLSMRVCAGTSKNKTPLLASKITRLELNPYWTVPFSIIRREIAPLHAEDVDYFERNRMHIIHKETQEELPPEQATAEELLSGKYTVRQEKGEGNSLGRLIFRFPNSFSIYLHDTNNPAAFQRTWRGVSHGCIRLQRPLDLAEFLFSNTDELRTDRIRLAIDLPPLTAKGRALQNNPNYRPIGFCTYEPSVPVYITYHTVFPDLEGQLIYYPDVYQYDAHILRSLDAYR